MIEMDDREIRQAMQALGRALNSNKSGKIIKRQLSKRLREIMQPMVARRRAAVLRLPSQGHDGPSMRQAIAKQIRGATRYSGNSTGLSIIQRARGMPRGFDQAGRAFNRAEGWTPRTLGGELVRQQIRPAAWFDREESHDEPTARREITAALEKAAGMLADDIRRIR